jgi:transcriptional regulator with XRE-family HTH domain
MLTADNVLLSVGVIASGRQITAARALMGWTRDDLGARTGLHPKTVAYWERMTRQALSGLAIDKIRNVFREHGVEFIGGDGFGVRKKSAAADPSFSG